jgi:hypothetical protein
MAGLGHFDVFRRVYDAFALIGKMGISASALIQATTNEPTGNTVRELQAALRARYDPADWRDVVRPISDEMRGLQRDALVAYILHQMRSNPTSAHIDTPDKLFEYFLMDVQMDPCMQTSRIRHALSSVQLFIERCFMNLEPRVLPAAFSDAKRKQWEWMKRYRVWEANRKVYLFPENWLEPELRDDKSPFFKEIESELLQSDITEDSAATALVNYLSKLEEVAKLEPCGIHHVPADEHNGTAEIDHVVARTAGAHRKYYYRRYEYGYWTPWEQIKLDIEDNPVIPMVWNDRLFVFWLRILKQGPDPAQKPFSKEGALTSLDTSDLKTEPPKATIQAVLCWSEYYNGKWQPTKTSDVNAPTTINDFPPTGNQAFNRSEVQLQIAPYGDSLLVTINPPGYGYPPVRPPGIGGFILYNTHSLPVRFEDVALPILNATWYDRSFLDSAQYPFLLIYMHQYFVWVLFPWVGWLPVEQYDQFERDILPNSVGRVVEPQPGWPTDWPSWDKPFFFEDSRHVFFVTTTETQVLVSNYPGYGFAGNHGLYHSAQIPPLIVQTGPRPPVRPEFSGDGGSMGPDPGIIDPAPMRRFVTEDAYIRNGIGTTGGVMYGDRQIGPSGTLMRVRAGV